jgi:IS1381, transposase orfA
MLRGAKIKDDIREYRIYEQMSVDFGIDESNLLRRSCWVEEVLV